MSKQQSIDVSFVIGPSVYYGHSQKPPTHFPVSTCLSSSHLAPTRHHHVKTTACIDTCLVISPSLHYGKVLTCFDNLQLIFLNSTYE